MTAQNTQTDEMPTFDYDKVLRDNPDTGKPLPSFIQEQADQMGITFFSEAYDRQIAKDLMGDMDKLAQEAEVKMDEIHRESRRIAEITYKVKGCCRWALANDRVSVEEKKAYQQILDMIENQLADRPEAG
jgi:hypothetical protein